MVKVDAVDGGYIWVNPNLVIAVAPRVINRIPSLGETIITTAVGQMIVKGDPEQVARSLGSGLVLQ